jgi:hypothetical protein
MAQRMLLLAALLVFLGRPAAARAQLTFEELKVFDRLLAEPDGKAAFDKRLQLIGDAMDREGEKKPFPAPMIPVDLKRARIPAAQGVPFLLKRLEQPADVSKRTVLRMLSVYGVDAKSAAPPVLELLKKNPSRPVLIDAMLTVAKVDPTNTAGAAVILERLGNDDADDASNRAALQALAAMASVVPKAAVPRIAKFQEHRLTDLGVTAHEVIGKILALERPTLEQLRMLKAIEWRDAADQGYSVLATIGEAGNKADFAAPLLVDLLATTPPPYLECVAIDTIYRLRTGNPQAIAAIVDRLLAQDVTVRSKARIAVQNFDLKQPEAVRALAAGLRHKSQFVRLDVATALRTWDDFERLPPPAHAEMLAPLLATLAEVDDTVPPLYLDVYLMLLRRFGAKAAPAGEGLVKLYQNDAYVKKFGPLSRGKVLAALANIGVPESGQALVLEILKKGPQKFDGGFSYAAAARAAGTFAKAEEVPLLLPGLTVNDKDLERALYFIDWSGTGQGKATTVRLETIRALAKMGPDAADALPALKEIAAAKGAKANLDLLALQEARRAYETIAGMPLPPAKGVFADGNVEMLHIDERLQVKMVLKLRNPRPQDVAKRLQQATKLTFTIDDNIDPDMPVWGSLFATGMPAWQCMRQFAASPNVQGKWEDTGDGYRLIATKKAPATKVAKKPFPPFKDDSFDPLPDDPRLQKSLTIQLNDARVQDILQLIQDATGVKFTLENVDTGTPLYKSVGWANTTAWMAMRNIAESPRVNGTWEKTGDGYRLRGTYTAPPPAAPAPVVAPRPDAVPVDPNLPAPKSYFALVAVLGVFVVILAGVLLALVIRLLRMSK